MTHWVCDLVWCLSFKLVWLYYSYFHPLTLKRSKSIVFFHCSRTLNKMQDEVRIKTAHIYWNHCQLARVNCAAGPFSKYSSTHWWGHLHWRRKEAAAYSPFECFHPDAKLKIPVTPWWGLKNWIAPQFCKPDSPWQSEEYQPTSPNQIDWLVSDWIQFPLTLVWPRVCTKSLAHSVLLYTSCDRPG